MGLALGLLAVMAGLLAASETAAPGGAGRDWPSVAAR